MEGTSREEQEKLVISTLPFVRGLSFTVRRGTRIQDTVSTSTVILCFLTEVVVNNRVSVVCRANLPHIWTVCVSFTHESNRITVTSESLHHKYVKLTHQHPLQQNVLWMRDLCHATEMTC